MRSVVEMAQEVEATKGNRMPQLLSELGSERETLYESLAEATPKEEPKEPAPVEAKPEKEPGKETDKAEFVPEDKPKDEEKTVPYGALKEEREKRKELSRRIKELEDTVKLAADDNKKLVDLMSSKSDDEPITDYEKELVNAKKQLRLMRDEIESFKKGQTQQKEVTENQKLTDLVKQTDSELTKEGFEGFDDFVPQIVKAMNDEEVPMEERNPATWKKIYKEIVYPKYVGKYKPTEKESKKAEKEANKKDASLITNPGKVEAQKKEDDKPFNYTKWRSSQSIFNNPL
jgi:hypothetical protein